MDITRRWPIIQSHIMFSTRCRPQLSRVPIGCSSVIGTIQRISPAARKETSCRHETLSWQHAQVQCGLWRLPRRRDSLPKGVQSSPAHHPSEAKRRQETPSHRIPLSMKKLMKLSKPNRIDFELLAKYLRLDLWTNISLLSRAFINNLYIGLPDARVSIPRGKVDVRKTRWVQPRIYEGTVQVEVWV